MVNKNIDEKFEDVKRNNSFESPDFEIEKIIKENNIQQLEEIRDNLEEVSLNNKQNKSERELDVNIDSVRNNGNFITKKKIEDILARDYIDVYKKMSQARQKKFKDVGEMVAGKIKDLLYKEKGIVGKNIIKILADKILKVFYDPDKDLIKKVSKITKLIRNWLLISPDIDENFAEQEAKIKTDEIIKLIKN